MTSGLNILLIALLAVSFFYFARGKAIASANGKQNGKQNEELAKLTPKDHQNRGRQRKVLRTM